MSSSSNNKLRILWEHFIHAEPQSYEVNIPTYILCETKIKRNMFIIHMFVVSSLIAQLIYASRE